MLGIRFHIGDPAQRRIIPESVPAYDQAVFDGILTRLEVLSVDDEKGTALIADPSIDDYMLVGAMFGDPIFKTTCAINRVWLFDWSLRIERITHSGQSYRLKHGQGYDAREIPPEEQLHDRAVAEIVFEGFEPSTYEWDSNSCKFSCLRFHNLDLKPLRVNFAWIGQHIEIPALGCRTVRFTGFDADGRRTGILKGLNYLWPLQRGDAPIFESRRDRTAGVWGSPGFNPACSLSMAHQWLGLGYGLLGSGRYAGICYDPRVAWDGSSYYESRIGGVEDSDLVGRYGVQLGKFRILTHDDDGNWTTAIDEFTWVSNRILSNTIGAAMSGSFVTLSSKLGGAPHDVVPMGTTLFGSGVVDATEASIFQPIIGDVVQRVRWESSQFEWSSTYIGGSGSPVTVSATLSTSDETSAITSEEPFAQTIGELRALKITPASTTETADSDLTVFSGQIAIFDGKTLKLAFSSATSLSRAFAFDISTRSPAEWGIDSNEIRQHYGFEVIHLLPDTNAMIGRGPLWYQDAGGFELPDGWRFVEHPDFYAGDPGADYRWRAPAPFKSQFQFSMPLPAPEATRNGVLFPVGSNLPRALQAAEAPDRWGEHRDALLAGELQDVDRQRVWRARAAIEHLNWLIAKVNSIRGVVPFDFRDLIYWGRRWDRSAPGPWRPSRYGCRVDDDEDLRAAALALGMEINTLAELSDIDRLLEEDERFSDGRTYLASVADQLGIEVDDGMPEFSWVSIDDIVSEADRLGVWMHHETLVVPGRVSVLEGKRNTVFENFNWYSEDDFAAVWESPDGGEIVSEPSDATHALTIKGSPVAFNDDPLENQDFIAGAYDVPGQAQFPFGEPRRALRIEAATTAPTLPDGWSTSIETRITAFPIPFLAWDGTTPNRNLVGFVPIRAVEQPPVNPVAILATRLDPGFQQIDLTPETMRDAFAAEGIPSEDWGERLTCVVQHLPRVWVAKNGS